MKINNDVLIIIALLVSVFMIGLVFWPHSDLSCQQCVEGVIK